VTWAAHQVVFKLKSPLHIGHGKVGNVQRTRTYVTGRVFWGGLTMRLTRDATDEPATDSKQYESYGNQVDNNLAFTYFYPAIKCKQDYKIQWWWKDESLFRRRFLSSYVSTALVYPQQAADEGLLHEVEFISPRRLDNGEQVYLVGYVFEREGCKLQWKDACHRMQIGGEQGYGWGDLQYVEVKEVTDTKTVFNSNYSWREQESSIVIQTLENDKTLENRRLLAHTKITEGLSVQGEIEPLVGWESRSYNSNSYPKQRLEKYCDPCWIPGSKVSPSSAFVIKKFGLWQAETISEK